LGLLVIVRKRNNIEKVTYHDGWFYEPPMDLNNYFFKRLGVSKEKAADKEINKKELEMNTSRGLKVESEPNRSPDDNIMVLVDNIGKGSADGENTIAKSKIKPVENIQHGLDIVHNGGNTNNMKCDFITYQDFSNIPSTQRFEYDMRDFKKYVGDELIQHHSVFKLFVKDSFVDPTWLSFIKLVYKINLVFGINAMVYSDYIIDRRAYYISSVILFITIGRFILPFEGRNL
jgi:hypothetical protein